LSFQCLRPSASLRAAGKNNNNNTGGRKRETNTQPIHLEKTNKQSNIQTNKQTNKQTNNKGRAPKSKQSCENIFKNLSGQNNLFRLSF
jgi:transcriptional regulator of met regulon